MFPHKLKKGSHIRVIAPSRSFRIISEPTREIAKTRLEELGFKVSYSLNADEIDGFANSPVQSRLDDLHAAFRDPKIDAILTAIGGFNTNQILDGIDYELIKKNPKILCGYSDITALLNAVSTQTGLVTYYGPHFSTFGMLHGAEYTVDYFKKCLTQEKGFELKPSKQWRDDPWFMDQENVNYEKNDGYWVINEGLNRLNVGAIAGGNLSVLMLLQGTKYFPDLKDSIVFVEADSVTMHTFAAELQSLLMQKNFNTVKALVIGRFQKASHLTRDILAKIIKACPELDKLPVIANVDFGHTTPNLTIPLGGIAEVNSHDVSIKILHH